MNLADLKAAGAVISDAPVKREIIWTRTVDGEEKTDTFNVHILPVAFGVMETALKGRADDERSMNATFIAQCILLGDGPEFEHFEYADAYWLDPSLAFQFVSAIRDVNGLARSAPKPSVPPTSSGTS